MQTAGKSRRKVTSAVRVIRPVVPLFLLALLLLLAVQRIPTTSINKDVIDAWKDVTSVVATGIIALSGAYVGGMLQAQQAREIEARETRKKRTTPYREYLSRILSLAQRIETASHMEMINKNIIDEWFPSEQRIAMAHDLPPLAELSAIDDDDIRNIVDHAIRMALKYIGLSDEDRPTKANVRKAYQDAISALDLYDEMN